MANQRITTAPELSQQQGWTHAVDYEPGTGVEAGTARALMHPVPFVVSATDRLLDILSLTLLATPTPIPVMEDGLVVGALRAREIETLLLANDDDESWMVDLSARDVMVSPVTIIPVETVLLAVNHAVNAHAFKFVFVGRGRRVVGVITADDLGNQGDRAFRQSSDGNADDEDPDGWGRGWGAGWLGSW
jgi:predicted transcriptional regulator